MKRMFDVVYRQHLKYFAPAWGKILVFCSFTQIHCLLYCRPETYFVLC